MTVLCRFCEIVSLCECECAKAAKLLAEAAKGPVESEFGPSPLYIALCHDCNHNVTWRRSPTPQ